MELISETEERTEEMNGGCSCQDPWNGISSVFSIGILGECQ